MNLLSRVILKKHAKQRVCLLTEWKSTQNLTASHPFSFLIFIDPPPDISWKWGAICVNIKCMEIGNWKCHLSSKNWCTRLLLRVGVVQTSCSCDQNMRCLVMRITAVCSLFLNSNELPSGFKSALNFIQSRRRSEEVCFAEDNFKCWKSNSSWCRRLLFQFGRQEDTVWSQGALLPWGAARPDVRSSLVAWPTEWVQRSCCCCA